jgi:hypothetical protein
MQLKRGHAHDSFTIRVPKGIFNFKKIVKDNFRFS